MNSFELKVWDDEGKKCTFYTVQNELDEISETDRFIIKFKNDPAYKIYLQELLLFLRLKIASEYGAINELLNRFENQVVGLPTKGKVSLANEVFYFPRFPLRLYVLKITDEILILFNGGVKDDSTNQLSSLNLKWREACEYAKKIEKAFIEKEFYIDGRYLKSATNTERIIIW